MGKLSDLNEGIKRKTRQFSELKDRATLKLIEMKERGDEINEDIKAKARRLTTMKDLAIVKMKERGYMADDHDEGGDKSFTSSDDETDDDEISAESKSRSKSISKNKVPKCDLECVYGKPKKYMNVNDYKYEGPVKIVVMKPGPFNTRVSKEWQAALLTLSFMAMGATSMTAYFYTISFKTHYSINAHIVLCTMAFQFCFPSAYFVENRLSIPAAYMTERHKRIEAFVFRFMALVHIAIAYSIYYKWADWLPAAEDPIHQLFGMAAVAGLAGEFILIIIRIGFTNPISPSERKQKCRKLVYYTQNFAGIMTLVCGIAAFATGVQKPAIMEWLPEKQNMGHFIIIISVFYPITAFCVVNAHVLDSIVDWIYIKNKAIRRLTKPKCAPLDD